MTDAAPASLYPSDAENEAVHAEFGGGHRVAISALL